MPKLVNTEISNLKKYLRGFARSSRQLNGLNESDAELWRGRGGNFAITTDILSDEISWGLYRDPELIGWMAAVVSLSDLSAVGARAEGLLLGAHWGREATPKFRTGVYRGLNKALRAHGVPLLGGDESRGSETVLASTVFGWNDEPPLMRMGIRPGDLVYGLGFFGAGPALGLRILFDLPASAFPEKKFRPHVRGWGHERRLVKAAMDVSDGLASTLCVLADLNHVSFRVQPGDEFFDSSARVFARRARVPTDVLYFVEHGDYQNLAVIRARDRQAFERTCPSARLLAEARPGRESSLIGGVPMNAIYNGPKKSLRDYRIGFRRLIRSLRS